MRAPPISRTAQRARAPALTVVLTRSLRPILRLPTRPRRRARRRTRSPTPSGALRRRRRPRPQPKPRASSRRAEALPPEPDAGAPGVARVAVRMPDGRRLDRRWAKEAPLSLLLDWVEGAELHDDYEVLLELHFPRRAFGRAEGHLSLEEAGLHPQALLYVRVREAETDDDEEGEGAGGREGGGPPAPADMPAA